MTIGKTRRQARGVRAFFSWGLGLVLMTGALYAQAEIVQGQLELQWGDPRGEPGQARQSSRFRATLVTDTGARHALDPAQARRAAGDLYALANRRVAVDFSTIKRSHGMARRIDAIAAADRLWLDGKRDAAKLVQKAVLGNTRWVTIACKFSDIATEQKPLSFFQGQYGTSPGQLGHYWNEVSYGKVSLTGSTAVGWLALPHPRSHYVTTDAQGEEDADLDALFDDCTAAADSLVNFSGVQGINMMFNGDLDGYAWGGGSCGVLEGVSTCIRNTWNPPWAFQNLAPLAHEMGHGYGLPHSDNADNDDDTYDNPWDVMSDGWSNAVPNATYGTLPKHINIYQRDRLGWVDAARKRTVPAGGSVWEVVVDSASLAGSGNPQMILLAAPEVTSAPGVGVNAVAQYSVEVRKRTGSYETALAGDAVIIHGIDSDGTAFSMDTDIPAANRSNNEGSMFKPGETWISADGSRRVKVLSATANGFVLRIGNPRVLGGPLRPRLQPAAIASPAQARPAPATVTRQGRSARCGGSRVASGTHCGDRIR